MECIDCCFSSTAYLFPTVSDSLTMLIMGEIGIDRKRIINSVSFISQSPS